MNIWFSKAKANYLFIVLFLVYPVKLYITKACGICCRGLKFSRTGATGGVWKRVRSGKREE